MSQIKVYGVDDQDERVQAVRAAQVTQFFIEFLQQGGPKPHVVIRLKINRVIQDKRSWEACRLGMDLWGGTDGVFHITPLPYSNASHAAHAAFEFNLKKAWTVENLISTIHQENFDLLDFSFAEGFKQPGDQTDYFDGCRDFIAQFFITLHRYGVVSWKVSRIDRGFFNSKNLKIVPGQTGFHQVIGYNYITNTTTTTVQDLPIARGTFNSDSGNCWRTITYKVNHNQKYHLPYHPKTLQFGDDGFKEPDTDWSEWGWNDEFKCYSRARWKNGVAEYEYNNEESSGKGKGKGTEASSADATTEVGSWPGDPSLPDACYFIRDSKYYYHGNQIISGPYECPTDAWVYSEGGWEDAEGTEKWRYWDGQNNTYQDSP